MFKPVLALSLLAPTTALAQGVSSSADLLADAKDDRWPVGAAIAVRDSPYLGEVTPVRPLPQAMARDLSWRRVQPLASQSGLAP